MATAAWWAGRGEAAGGTGRFRRDAGIAIGPILFVVAILAVLVAAIAAGSGGFSASSAAQASRIVASTVVEQASNLKAGVDNLMVGGTDPASIVTSGAGASTGTTGLFSPTGGGVAPQTPPKAAVYGTSDWSFPTNATIFGVGNGGNLIAALMVNQQTCQAINQLLFGSTAIDTVSGVYSAPGNVVASLSVLSGSTGRMQACVAFSTDYIFYQVLAIG